MIDLKRLRAGIDKDLSRKKLLDGQIKEENKILERSRKHCEDSVEAQEIVQVAAAEAQTEAHKKIAGVVSQCLSLIWDEPYLFHIAFERRRDQTEASLRFVRRGYEIDPLSGTEGGALDVASFALRLSCLLFSKPRLRPLLVLDEPFKMLSAQNRPRVADLLESVSRDMGVQIIMVTHSPDLMVGKVIRVGEST